MSKCLEVHVLEHLEDRPERIVLDRPIFIVLSSWDKSFVILTDVSIGIGVDVRASGDRRQRARRRSCRGSRAVCDVWVARGPRAAAPPPPVVAAQAGIREGRTSLRPRYLFIYSFIRFPHPPTSFRFSAQGNPGINSGSPGSVKINRGKKRIDFVLRPICR